ncbi:MAG: GNAT family N-acetyltransferase [Lachnospirales bacterium]
MNILNEKQKPWKEIKEIYFEAFPKSERKPFFAIRHSVKKGKAQLLTAVENGILQGFMMVIPYKDMIMVDYLAVSGKIRSRGTGSKILQEVCRRFPDKKIVLLIERLDDSAENKEQRIARRKFYFKNGFTSSDIYITGHSGNMEILNFGGTVSLQEYMDLQRYTLGKLMFRMSGIRPAV